MHLDNGLQHHKKQHQLLHHLSMEQVERLLLPFGLHHMLTIPMNYTPLGGVYTILTGANAGSIVAGQDHYG